VEEVSRRLGVSARHVKRLKSRMRLLGDAAAIHGSKGRKAGNALDAGLCRRILEIRSKPVYCDTNFSHFRELLASDFGISASYSALHSLLTRAGVKSKKCRSRPPKKPHRHRARRRCLGELLQTDGSQYDWLGTGERHVLHGFVDDATGMVTALYMSRNECLQGYLEALRATLSRHGIPEGIYSDKCGVFSVNGKSLEFKDLDGKDTRKTQMGRILDILGVESILANSPQAKGRIERLWGTLQDRLPVFFARRGIKTIAQANEAMPRFMEEHNARFAVRPASEASRFVPVPDGLDLDTILAARHERTADRCGAFKFMNLTFQVETQESIAGKRICFLFSDKIGLKAELGKKLYGVKPLNLGGNRKSPVPNVLKDLIRRCYLADARMPNHRGMA